ncbi:MAG TPA: hypothetical protein VFZ61_05795, partial [Polyangiales bacterium]
ASLASASESASASEPTHQLFLREWFELPDGAPGKRCRVDSARRLLTESAAPVARDLRVRADVHAIDLELTCENAAGRAIPSREALPADAHLLLLREAERRAPRPTAAQEPRDHVLFELPDARDGFLPAPRRYALDTGLPSIARERGVGRLRVEARGLVIEVALRERLHDAALDQLLDALVHGLCSGESLDSVSAGAEGQAAARELAGAFAAVTARFRPARLELAQVIERGPELGVVLSATRPRSHARSFEVARFELGLTRAHTGGWQLRSFDNREAAVAALECERMEEGLQRELSAQRVKAGDERCNALGTLLPGPCNELDPNLLARALALGARCRGELRAADADEPESSEPAKRRTLPDDFQLTMRRGRSLGGLDREPRYVVALFHQGQVVFHGRHWVTSKERSDGRTLPRLLAELYAHVQRLDWFGRRGGQYDPDGCIPSEDDGDVITVTAAGRQRMVLARAGCRGPFSEAELTGLRRHVERVAGIWGWTEPQRADPQAGDDARVQRWAIAE